MRTMHPYRWNHSHRSIRRTAFYWLLGLWAIELTLWICVATIVGCYYLAKFVMPYVIRLTGYVLAFVVFACTALFLYLRGRRRSRAYTADGEGTISP